MRVGSRSNYKFILKDWISIKDISMLSKVLESNWFSQNLEPITIERPHVDKAFVIAPHADDDFISSGGTLIRMIKAGSRIKTLYVTRPGDVTIDESIKVSREAGTEIEFLKYKPRHIPIDEKSIERLRHSLLAYRPKAVFMPFIADDHEDHRACTRLFYEAFKDETDLNFEVWAYQVYSTILPNVIIDITDQIDEKLKFVSMWRSQAKSRNWVHYCQGRAAAASRFLKTNEARYAEPFFVIPAKEYIELCAVYFGKDNEKDYKKIT